MKIRHSKKRILSNLLLGALFILGAVVKITEPTATYFAFFQLILGLLMIGSFFFEQHHQYLKIQGELLVKNAIRRKTIPLDEVVQISSLPGRIKIFTEKEKLSINTMIIDQDSLNNLYPILGSLDLDPAHNPFSGYSRSRHN